MPDCAHERGVEWPSRDLPGNDPSNRPFRRFPRFRGAGNAVKAGLGRGA